MPKTTFQANQSSERAFSMTQPNLIRDYRFRFALKYGCNPQQSPAGVYSLSGRELPFKVLSGQPGYINLLDGLNAWQLVWELKTALGLTAAASFKHASPAGAAVAVPLTPMEKTCYEAEGIHLTPPALAWLRARQADPMSSFGDFAALSDVVDGAAARLIKTEVSDGLIAPGFEPEALEILKAKKGGRFILLEANPGYTPPAEEVKEVFGVALTQRRNDTLMGPQHLENIVTAQKTLTPEARRDLIVAAITLKYTQSNSVGYAINGQMIGVGAGQQNRVDCTKLAGGKALVWFLRQHPKVLALPFKAGSKKVDRTNARVRYIEGDFTPNEYTGWVGRFESTPPALENSEKTEWMAGLKGVCLASDAFFPFRDSIDQAAKRGVSFIIQPGGSQADEEVIRACDEYRMTMAFSGVRLFHH